MITNHGWHIAKYSVKTNIQAQVAHYLERRVVTGTIHYLSDGLETLHYHACEILAIIVTPGSLPGNVWLHCHYGTIL